MNKIITAVIMLISLVALTGMSTAVSADSVITDSVDIDAEYWSEYHYSTFNKTEYTYQTSFRAEVHPDPPDHPDGTLYHKNDMKYLDVVISKGTVKDDTPRLIDNKDADILDVVNIVISENIIINVEDATEIVFDDLWTGVYKVYKDIVTFDLVITNDGKATYLPNLKADFILLKIDLSKYPLVNTPLIFDWTNHTAEETNYSVYIDPDKTKPEELNYINRLMNSDTDFKLDVTSTVEKNAGEYKANVKVNNDSQYFTGEWNNVKWIIKPKDINLTNVSVSSLTYIKDKLQTPVITVTDTGADGKTYILNAEELVSEGYNQPDYNVKITPQSEIGTYSATIIGDNNFDKSRTESWPILPAKITKITVEPKEFTYNAEVQGPTKITVYSYKTVLEPGVDYTLSGTFEATDAGTYSITATGESNYTGSKTAKWHINPCSDWYSTIDPDTFIYNGSEQAPEVTIHTPFAKYIMKGVSAANDIPFTISGTYIAVDVGDYTLTVKPSNNNFSPDDNKNAHTWKILEPETLKGILHVNHIDYAGFIDASTFEGKIFLMQGATYDDASYGNEIIFDGYGKEIPADAYSITVKDGWGQLVFSNNEDDLNKARSMNMVPSNTTSSEWNWIKIEGIATKGYQGSIVGHFYVNFNDSDIPKSYEIGDSFTKDSITYTVTSLDNKTVSVTGYEAGIQAGVAIPDYVDGFKVTKIGAKAFYGCKTITSVDLGENITSVGIKAFANCTKLETVVFDDALKTISAYAFYNCGKLTSIDLPDKVRTIGSYAFYKCNALTSVSFDDALKTVGTKAFTVSFENSSGKVLKQTAKNLAGKTFEGSDKVLKLVA